MAKLRLYRWIAAFSLILLDCGYSTAVTSGWIHPDRGKFTIGIDAGRMTGRDLELNRQRRAKVRAENSYFGVRVGYCFADNAEIYGRVGLADLVATDISNAAWGGKYNAQNEAAWGLGLQGILAGNRTMSIAGDAQYMAHSGHTAVATSGRFTESDWERWQVGIQAQGTLMNLRPYAGVRYSSARIQNVTASGTAIGDISSVDNIGGFAGAGWEFSEKISIYFEGRFADETSYGGGLRYHF